MSESIPIPELVDRVLAELQRLHYMESTQTSTVSSTVVFCIMPVPRVLAIIRKHSADSSLRPPMAALGPN